MDSSSPQIYRPLQTNEIRLTEILSDCFTRPAQCKLSYVSLDTLSCYSALSYTWTQPLSTSNASSDPIAEILVDGKSLQISANLEQALVGSQVLRGKTLWVDAICIDQSNVHERNGQVLLMGSIFTQAFEVVVWLGPSSANSDLGFRFLHELASHVQNPDRFMWLQSIAEDTAYFDRWKAFRDLILRPWWKRAWVVQEFVLGRTTVFCCGHSQMDGQTMELVDELLFDGWAKVFLKPAFLSLRLNSRVLDTMRNLHSLKRRRCAGRPVGLLTLLSMTKETYATDERDFLFAKWGLGGNVATDICKPNYTKATATVCEEFAKSYIEKRKNLYVICHAGMTPRLNPSLSTWVPDWGTKRPIYPLRCSWTEDPTKWPCFNAHRNTTPKVSFDEVGGLCLLQAEGVLYDEIDGVQYDPWAHRPPEHAHGIQSRGTNNAYSSKEAAFDALVRTVVADTDRWIWSYDGVSDPVQAPETFKSLFARYCQVCNHLLESMNTPQGEMPNFPRPASPSNIEKRWHGMRNLRLGEWFLRDLQEDYLQGDLIDMLSKSALPESAQFKPILAHPLWPAFEHSLGQAMYHRRVFTTVKGFLGLGSRTLTSGDRICILLGCPVPVILRPDGGQYRLIGECYVHGIMNGETMMPSVTGTEPLAELLPIL
jgi:hypothetical protein